MNNKNSKNLPFSISDESPREILAQLLPGCRFPIDLSDKVLWDIFFDLFKEPTPLRNKLTNYNTIDDVIELIKKSSKIIILSGAGISTSAGIPDFRSRDGVYARLKKDYPDLPDPKAMFDIIYFRENPKPFFKFAKEIYPGEVKPAVGHSFIKILEDNRKLLRNYTQNIDTLEKQAGIKRVIECHGSFATASCTNCSHQVDSDAIRNQIMNQDIPLCPVCPKPTDSSTRQLPIMKPDIVFFGESLGDRFHDAIENDKNEVDLLVVIGSSLKVKPVAMLPTLIPSNVPQILINREPLSHMNFDIELLGDCDDIIQEICLRLGDGWSQICSSNAKLLKKFDESILNIIPTIQDKKKRSDKLIAQKSKVQKTIHLEGPSVSNISPNQQTMIEISKDANQKKSDDESSDQSDSSSTDSEKNMNSPEVVVLPESSFVFLKPSRCLFRGAEISISSIRAYIDTQPRNNQ